MRTPAIIYIAIVSCIMLWQAYKIFKKTGVIQAWLKERRLRRKGKRDMKLVAGAMLCAIGLHDWADQYPGDPSCKRGACDRGPLAKR